MLLRDGILLRWTKSKGKCATTSSTLYALIRFGTMSRLPQAPVRSPPGTARYQVWEHAFYFITKPSGNIGNHWGNKSGCDALGHRIKPYKTNGELTISMFHVIRFGTMSRRPQAPVRSPPGTARYQVWEHTFPLQRPRGALREVQQSHWAPSV